MTTPILDFVRGYAQSGTVRMHMPGHKGVGPLGLEAYDLTEIAGADELYAPEGIIAESEANAAALFGSRATAYSTEGSTQCIKSMLYLARTHRGAQSATVLAARNVHKAFVYAAAELDLDVQWLWSEDASSLCTCRITAEGLENELRGCRETPCAVYVTSPDYLGRRLDLPALAEVCHRYGTLLLVDGAHGAYLPFIEDLNAVGCADLWCTSAHKTLPVLTGGAYLHIGKDAPDGIERDAKSAMAVFGSTSPSYLILASLDACNAYLAGEGAEELKRAAQRLCDLKSVLRAQGWETVDEEPLKITLNAAACGTSGAEIAAHLRRHSIEIEYADPDYAVLMASAQTTDADLARISKALEAFPKGTRKQENEENGSYGGQTETEQREDEADRGYGGQINLPLRVGANYREESTDLQPETEDGGCGGQINLPLRIGAIIEGNAEITQCGELKRVRKPYDLRVRPERATSIREGVFALSEEVRIEDAVGRICAAPAVSCPPAVPIVVSGERIDADAAEAMRYYGTRTIRVLYDQK